MILMLYGGGLAAVHRRNFGALRSIAIDAQMRTDTGMIPVVGVSHVWRVFQNAKIAANVLAREASGAMTAEAALSDLRGRRLGDLHTPVSDYLYARLRETLRAVVADDDDYTDTFDNLEVLLGVLATDTRIQLEGSRIYADSAWFGSFTWRNNMRQLTREQAFEQDVHEAGANWAPLQTGLFGGSSERALAAINEFNEGAQKARQGRF